MINHSISFNTQKGKKEEDECMILYSNVGHPIAFIVIKTSTLDNSCQGWNNNLGYNLK